MEEPTKPVTNSVLFAGWFAALFCAALLYVPDIGNSAMSQSDIDNRVSFFYAGSAVALISMWVFKRYSVTKWGRVLFCLLPGVVFALSAFAGSHFKFPFIAGVEVTAISTAKMRAGELTAAERADLATGQIYLLTELKLRAVAKPLTIEPFETRWVLFTEGGRYSASEGAALLQPRRRWCKTLAPETLPQGSTLTCWAAFRVPADATSGSLEFTNFRVSDRTPTFRF